MHTALADLQVIPEKELSCDVLVVGMGFSGPVAAVRAAENGAKVIVIDKQPKNWWTPGGITMIHAELHLAFRTLDQPEEELRRGLLDCTDGFYPRDLLDATVTNAGRAYQWLQDHGGEFQGIRFHPQGPNRVWGRIKPGGIYDLANTGVKKLTLSLEKQLEEHGGQVLYSTKALNFVTSTKGEVVGVMARDEGGQFKINAKSVILAAGGYGENADMLVKYVGAKADEVIRWVGPWSTGDGHKMAEEIDAQTRSMGHAAFSHYYSMDSYQNEDLLGAYLDTPANHGIIVDRDGHRFVDETLGPRIVGPLMSKTSIYKTGWIIIDEAIRNMPDVKAKIDDLIEFKGTLHVADTIEELAKKAGLGAGLKSTVDGFNEAVKAGTTPLLDVPKNDQGFAIGTGMVSGSRVFEIANGPFYAIPFANGIVTTYGGVMVNTDAQVLDWDDKPIPGLYAAGQSMMGSVCGGTENQAGAYVGYQAICLIFALLAAESVTRR